MALMRTFPHVVLLGLAFALAGCSKSSTSTTPTNSNIVTITSSGVSPKSIQISAGSRVLFVNNDNRSHDMTSDPHPEHTQCPELNQVGFLSAGQSRESGNLVTVRTCGFHDHGSPETVSLQGSVVIR